MASPVVLLLNISRLPSSTIQRDERHCMDIAKSLMQAARPTFENDLFNQLLEFNSHTGQGFESFSPSGQGGKA